HDDLCPRRAAAVPDGLPVSSLAPAGVRLHLALPVELPARAVPALLPLDVDAGPGDGGGAATDPAAPAGLLPVPPEGAGSRDAAGRLAAPAAAGGLRQFRDVHSGRARRAGHAGRLPGPGRILVGGAD